MTCNCQIRGQQPSTRSRLHALVKGAAMNFAILFKMLAGMRSGPVAFFSSTCWSNFKVYRVRMTMNSSSWHSGKPKYGQSTVSSGIFAFPAKAFANRSVLSLESCIQSSTFLSGGIEDILAFFCKSCRLSFHHILLPFLSVDIFSLSACRCRWYSSDRT